MFFPSGVTALAGGGIPTFKNFNLTCGERSGLVGYRDITFFYGSFVPDDYGTSRIVRLDASDQGLGVAQYILWIQGATENPPERYFDILQISGDFDVGNTQIEIFRKDMSASVTSGNVSIWTITDTLPMLLLGNVYSVNLSPETPSF